MEGERDTAFIKNGRDVFAESQGVRWWFPVLILVYVALLFGQWVTMQNITIPHTRFVNPGAPGDLYSLRYSSFQAILLEVMGTRIFLAVAILMLMALRHSYAWNVFIMVCILLLVALQVFVFAGLSWEYAEHSKDGRRFGLATDNWFCCAPERHAVITNGCINVLPCAPPVPAGFSAADLRANEPFLALYVVWKQKLVFVCNK